MKKKILLSSVLFVLLMLFLFLSVNSAKQNAIEHLNDRSRLTMKATYNAIIDTYEVAAKKDFNSLMSSPKVLEILHTLKITKNIKQRNLLRGELYRLLYKPYDMMQKMHMRQFQLHTDEGKSLLRMHLPYESEDTLMDARTSIRIANQEFKSVIGFEGGRVFPGFRYVYPIVDNGEHLGSVEFSISFEAIEDLIDKAMKEVRKQTSLRDFE